MDLSRLTLGYGFTRNSLSMSFRGALRLPEQLREDLDTADTIGAGVRLPRDTKLGFRFDIIPIPGPIPVVPLFEFDLDMRSDILPAVATGGRCEPSWDGLEMNIPGVVRVGLKHLAFAPMFGILPIPNIRFGGDVEVGNDSAGITVIVDEMFVLAGLLVQGWPPIPIPLLADPSTPYFDNVCVNVRLAGFGINVHLTRPFPKPSPMILFELIGLINDPMMPIDPAGELAGLMRASISDAFITLPESVRAILPDALGEIRKPLNAEINVGQLMTAVQATASTVGIVVDAITSAEPADVERAIRQVMADPPRIALGDVLAMLPPELRKTRVGGSLAGFDARVVVLLIEAGAPERLAAEFSLRDDPPAPAAPPAMQLGQQPSASELARYRPAMPADRTRRFDLDDPANSLFSGIEFAAFAAADIAAIPAHRNSGDPLRPVPAGVVIGARVSVFGRQRFRFMGYLFEDGSFGLVSAVDVGHIRLSVAGIGVELPFSVSGRLTLAGRHRRGGFYGFVSADGSGTWTIAPGVLRVELGLAGKPVHAEIHSAGTFALRGAGRILLFNGAVRIEGSIDISDTHCFVDGRFNWNTTSQVAGRPILALGLAVRGRVGPSSTFELGGAGTLTVLGNELLDVRGVVSHRGASVRARIDTKEWRIGGARIPCSVDMAIAGEINLAKRHKPTAFLEGAGSISVYGAQIVGRGGVTMGNDSFMTYVDGSLRWYDRQWLRGRVELGTAGITLSGHASLGLALTPSNLAGIELANLFFKLDVGATFRLDPAGGLVGFTIDGSWSLGASAPGTGQIFPLAAQRIEIGTDTGQLDKELISIGGFSLLPLRQMSGLTVPIPQFTPNYDDPPPVEIAVVDSVIGPILGFRWDAWNIGGVTDDNVRAKIPLGFSESTADVEIALPLDLSSSFKVALVWRSHHLQLKISRGNTQPQYHSL
ncbi:hypothetical protein [Nakamurella multipartita]|uniref:Uncharacterized protein n=1 Tax=Nakamurella multipartita (strain ATCC 700099 / DSM 44233 / CIP 104796 / JCM 9543 / NBRC 105858 / Y-104) TaxID=479431 RepID=C8X9Q5_NAKMY|nr:hypothetical protein [Nakamurella multipartita]ACV79213.1 hypothetical protein Namu_2872 [Nakamurella multipartita DSM 44233]